MPTEDDLRDLFASERVSHSIDPKRVIARSRSRRIPRQIGAAAVGALAIAGISVLGVQTITQQQQTASDSATTMQESSPSGAGDSEAFDSQKALEPKEIVPDIETGVCGGPVAEAAPSDSGLLLQVEFPAVSPVDASEVAGNIRVTNVTSERITGWTGIGMMTLSQDATVVWSFYGPVANVAYGLDLEPGESTDFPTAFTPARCDAGDVLNLPNPGDWEPIPAGQYDLTGTISYSPETGGFPEYTSLVSDPATITLE